MTQFSYYKQYFNGKTVFITGGSSGIGLSLVKRFAQFGCTVILAARDRVKLDDTVSAVLASYPGTRIVPISLDVREAASIHRLTEDLKALGVNVDILINSAGVSFPGFLDEMSLGAIKEMVDTNLAGTINMCRWFVSNFCSRAGAAIVNISSLAGQIPFAGYTVYAATKAGIIGFSEGLRNEVLKFGIQVSVVLPPDTDTPMYHSERSMIPPLTAKLSGTIKPISAEYVADEILLGIVKQKFKIVPGLEGRILNSLFSLFPIVGRLYLDGQVKSFLKKNELASPEIKPAPSRNETLT